MNCICQIREEIMHYEAVTRYEREEELIAPFPAAKVNTAIAPTSCSHHLLPLPNTINLPLLLAATCDSKKLHTKLHQKHKMEWMLSLLHQKL